MSASIETILIIGATSGIGNAFARRFHQMGKKVIATGRRQANLSKLAQECPGLETYVMDNSDLASLGGHVKKLIATYPGINAVWVNSGIQNAYSFKDGLTADSDELIINEINVNNVAPTILARHFIPHLLSLKTDAVFMLTSSGIAFVPVGVYPVYSLTKAGTHHFCCAVRQQLAGTNVSILELAPPKVSTELDLHQKEGAGSAMQSMSLDNYTDEVFKILDGNNAKDLKEVAVGFAANGAKAWRGAFQPVLDNLKSPA